MSLFLRSELLKGIPYGAVARRSNFKAWTSTAVLVNWWLLLYIIMKRNDRIQKDWSNIHYHPMKHVFYYLFTSALQRRKQAETSDFIKITLWVSGKACTWTRGNSSVLSTTTVLCITRNTYFHIQMPSVLLPHRGGQISRSNPIKQSKAEHTIQLRVSFYRKISEFYK